MCLEMHEALLPSSGYAVHKKSIWMTEVKLNICYDYIISTERERE